MDSHCADPTVAPRVAARQAAVCGDSFPASVRLQRMEAMINVAEAVLHAVQNEQRLAARVAEAAASTMFGSAGVWLQRQDSGEPWWASDGHGELPAELATSLWPLVRGWLDERVQSGDDGPTLVGAAELAAWKEREASISIALDDDARCALFPVVASSRLLGGLVVAWPKDPPELTDEDLAFGRSLARLAGITMFNARMLADSADAMELLRQSGELIEHMSDAVISCDADLQVVSWNAAAERIYGYSNAEAAGCDLFALLCTEFTTKDGTPVSLSDVFAAAEAGEWEGESRERRSDGASVITMAKLTSRAGPDGRLEQLIIVNRDITAQRREEHEALHDPLTGLPNRRLMTDRLYKAYEHACRHHHPIAVLFIDLDGFKPINDTFGHAAGDEVLKAVAARLTATVRAADTVARIGGDEFVVILHETGPRASVEDVARRILDIVAEPVEFADTEVRVLASVGIAHTVDPAAEAAAEELLDAADLAMYEAKRQRLGMAFAEGDPLGEDDASAEDSAVGDDGRDGRRDDDLPSGERVPAATASAGTLSG